MVARTGRSVVGTVLAVREPHTRNNNRQAEVDSAWRTITLADVKVWFENCKKPRPSDAICNEVAARLTKMRWPRDIGPPYVPPPPKPANWPKRRKWPPPVRNDDAWWDQLDDVVRRAQTAAAALKALEGTLPATLELLERWQRDEQLRQELGLWLQREQLQWVPKTDAYEAVIALSKALARALPHIKFPFFRAFERKDHRQKRRPKNWHLPAVLIANIIERALIQSGRRTTSTTSGDSTVVKVVRNALARMGYGEIEPGTIAARLTSWKNNQALLAKQARLALAKFGTTI